MKAQHYGRGHRHSDNHKQKVLELSSEGYTLKDIHELTGISKTTINKWRRAAGLQECQKDESSINENLLMMAKGNDLNPWVGRIITDLHPREIYDFLRALNVKGELKVIVEHTIKL